MEKPDQSIHADSGTQTLPELDQGIMCKEHPLSFPEIAYGLAGGGIGTYSYCPVCGNILSKSQDPGD